MYAERQDPLADTAKAAEGAQLPSSCSPACNEGAGPFSPACSEAECCLTCFAGDAQFDEASSILPPPDINQLELIAKVQLEALCTA